MWGRRDWITREQLNEALADLEGRIMSVTATQADIDAITATLDQVATDIATASTDIQNELNQLVSANPAIDISKLQAAAAPLDAAVKALGELKPAAPAPAPATAPTQPVYTFSGDPSTIPAATWLTSGFETDETPPRLLYYFAQDTAGSGQTGTAGGNGADGGAWVAWTGAVQAVPTG